jgi:tRNA(adenine34) deaminase
LLFIFKQYILGGFILDDKYFMREALKEAKNAFQNGEIPIGAVVVCNERVIARAHNMTELLNDVTAHAEMQAITAAANFLGSKYLNDCTLYVTVEPCVMCAGAIFWTQLQRVVFGAADEKRGCSNVGVPLFHPKTKLTSGVMEEECSQLMKAFFAGKR